MSTHENIEELADLATAGAWEPDAHATSCGSCAAALTAAREFHTWAVGLVAVDAPPPGLEDRLVAAFRATGTAAARRFRLLPGRRVLAWAAGAAALLGVVILGDSFGRTDGASLKTLASAQADFRGNDRDGGEGFWAERPTFAIESLEAAGEKGEVEGRRLRLLSPTAGGAGPLTGATFGFDAGLAGNGKGWGFGATKLGEENGRSQSFHAFSLGDGIDGALALSDGTRGERLNEYQLGLQVKNAEPAQRGGDAEKNFAPVPLPDSAGKTAGLSLGRQPESLAAESMLRRLDERGASTIEPVDAATAAVELDRKADAKPKPSMNDFPGVDLKLVQDARKLIRTARLAMEVDAYEAAQVKVSAAAVEEKGYVASADTERLQNGKIRATVTLRVPPDRFEALLAKLRALGTVRNQTLGTQDVSKAYVDMEARLGAKQALLDRLKKVLAEAKGNVKELMEVEVQMGATLEQIEALKGELKYLDNQVSLATITLELAEKDLGQPFEYVQTLQSRIGLVTSDVDAAYAAAQKAVVDAGGQVVDSKMTRQNDGAALGTIKARVDAAKFPDVRQALRALGHVETDTVDQQKTARGGEPTASAPVRVEQATIDLSVTTPALLITRRAQIVVESKAVDAAYAAARKAVEAAGGRILDGGLSNRTDGGSASLKAQVDVAKFADLVETFKAAGEVKHAVVNQSAGVVAVPVRERAEVDLILRSPPQLIGEEQGIGRLVRDTFARSWGGLLWSVEKLFVGLSLAGPWALALVVAWLVWRRTRRPKAPAAQ